MHSSNVKENPLPSKTVAHQFPDHLQNRLLITPVEAGACVGWAKQTVYNKLNDDVFPIPLVEFNGRMMVKTSDLLEYVKKLPHVKHVFKKTGRPTKVESIRRALEKKAGEI
jgi:hypothetical protein